MKTIALIGDPVAQSPSPAMHRAAFMVTGLELDYVAEHVTADELPLAFPRLREEHVGLNVTRPLKEAVVPLLDEVQGEASETGSVNTVTFRDGRAVGDSTDGAGFIAALRHAGAPFPQNALILGAGGAVLAVGAALRRERAEVTIAARRPERAAAAAEVIGGAGISLEAGVLEPVLAAADLLVNATPLGERSPLPNGLVLHPEMTVFDLVYRPRVTRLLAAAREVGCRTVEGVEMLVEQGARSFEIWTGRPAPIDAMRDAALGALGEQAAV